MKTKITTVVCAALVGCSLSLSAFAGGMGCQSKSMMYSSCGQSSQFCGYQVGTVPAGKCAASCAQPSSSFCGYLVGTVPAGKCVSMYVK